ncbi:hypothetical protein [Roseibium suaedae]|uniref:hypothetical protein n=1 Tax=Roseibium suaedae TaxID=735517 RepID=UPI001114F031|nr:hypothetical protein [Roseibium suaedae]
MAGIFAPTDETPKPFQPTGPGGALGRFPPDSGLDSSFQPLPCASWQEGFLIPALAGLILKRKEIPDRNHPGRVSSMPLAQKGFARLAAEGINISIFINSVLKSVEKRNRPFLSPSIRA